jgi:hypothetical protein
VVGHARTRQQQGGRSISTVVDPFDNLPGFNGNPAPPVQLGLIEQELLRRGGRIEKRLLSLRRDPKTGTVTEGGVVKAKSVKKARKKLRKQSMPMSEKRLQKLLSKAAQISEPVRCDAKLAKIAKRARAAESKPADFIGKAKAQLADAARAMHVEQLYGPDPIKRDRAWMALHGIEEVGK